VQEPEFAIDVPPWWEPLALPIWRPVLDETIALRDALAGHIISSLDNLSQAQDATGEWGWTNRDGATHPRNIRGKASDEAAEKPAFGCGFNWYSRAEMLFSSAAAQTRLDLISTGAVGEMPARGKRDQKTGRRGEGAFRWM
jgi:hypothetical protein